MERCLPISYPPTLEALVTFLASLALPLILLSARMQRFRGRIIFVSAFRATTTTPELDGRELALASSALPASFSTSRVERVVPFTWQIPVAVRILDSTSPVAPAR